MGKRAKNLTDTDIKQVVELLDGWSNKLTWELLIDAVELHMHSRYTRQALHKHERIRHAFDLKKKSLSGVDGNAKRMVTVEMQIALQQIERLKAENRRQASENDHLLEQFARWAYNAHARGLDKEFLNQPLPPVNRGKTSTSNDQKKITTPTRR